jgi:hypothetical protein
MIVVIEKGGAIAAPLVEFSSFAKAAKWLLECGALLGTQFEVWYVRRYKTKKDDVWLEAEYEVLP